MTMYSKPTPDTMHQNNLTFISVYNPKDPPQLLYKRCANCQEISIVVKVPYTSKQLLMNIVDLFTRSGIYTRNVDNWERKPDADKTYVNLRTFIQVMYQHCLASSVRLLQCRADMRQAIVFPGSPPKTTCQTMAQPKPL